MRLKYEDIYISRLYQKLLKENVKGMQELDAELKTMAPEYAQHFHRYVMPTHSFDYNKWDNAKKEQLCEKMIGFAKLTAKGIDVSELGAEYDVISPSVVDNLPKLRPISYYEQIDRIETAIQESCNINLTNLFFSSSENMENIPLQGWKIHISATDMDDYERLLTCVGRDLNEMGAVYKVVNPHAFERMQNSDQVGKLITVYITPEFDINKFSKESRDLLAEASLSPVGDYHLAGRLYARYGRCEGGHNAEFIVDTNGKMVKDGRHISAAPEFVGGYTPESIFNFYRDCEERFKEHCDLKRYLVERMTMLDLTGRCEDVLDNFVAFECNPKNANHILTDLNNRQGGGIACTISVDGHSYIVGDYETKMTCINRINRNRDGNTIYIASLDNYPYDYDKEEGFDFGDAPHKIDEWNDNVIFETSDVLESIYDKVYVPMVELYSIYKEDWPNLQSLIDSNCMSAHLINGEIYFRDDDYLIDDLRESNPEMKVRRTGYIEVPEENFNELYPALEFDSIVQSNDAPVIK